MTLQVRWIRQRMQRSAKRLQRRFRIRQRLSLHSVSLLLRTADQIIVLDEGEIKAIGRHEELMQSSDIYREVYESQKKGGDDNE